MTNWVAVEDVPGLAVKLSENRAGRLIVTACRIEAEAVTAELLRSIPLARIEREANESRRPSDDLPPLRRQPGQSPEEFSRLVAAHYAGVSRAVANPGAVLAAQWGVNPATMHTWIREARLRGLLPSARRGKS